MIVGGLKSRNVSTTRRARCLEIGATPCKAFATKLRYQYVSRKPQAATNGHYHSEKDVQKLIDGESGQRFRQSDMTYARSNSGCRRGYFEA